LRLYRRLTVLLAVAVGAAIVSEAFWAHPRIDPFPAGTTADRLVVEKAAHKLSVYSHGVLLRTYQVSLGRAGLDAKQREGDQRTPEGRYLIDRHNPSSGFHKALHVSYPSQADIARARAGGYPPGGDIMIHGIRNGLGWLGRAHLLSDWTAGCVAVTNEEIDDLYQIVRDGTPIELRP
jgi:murein L,D-transpeptidase YafK